MLPRTYDEMLLPDGPHGGHYRGYGAWLHAQSMDRLARRRAKADSMFHRVGITFAVYGEDEGTERLIPFDVVPRFLPGDEWRQLEAGLRRGRAGRADPLQRAVPARDAGHRRRAR